MVGMDGFSMVHLDDVLKLVTGLLLDFSSRAIIYKNSNK
jgi:hypothetical protein